MEYFWTNTIWYVLLGVLTLAELIIVMVKTRDRRLTMAFYLSILGIVLNFETSIFIFGKAYAYYPMIIKNPPRPIDDMLMGNLFSQTSVAATALLLIVLKLNYYWHLIFALTYGAIEELFLALGIYSQNWYRTWMTVVGLLFYFWLTNKMHEKIISGMKPIFYYGYIHLALFLPNSAILTHALIIMGYQEFNTVLFADPVNSRFLLFFLHFQLLSIPIIIMHFLRFKPIYKALVILMLYTVYYIGYKLNLIWIKDGWFMLVSTANIWWMYLFVFILDRLYGGTEKLASNRK